MKTWFFFQVSKRTLQVLRFIFQNLNRISPWSFKKSFRTFKILQLAKQTWTSAQFKLNWISEFFQNLQKFRSLHFKILWDLDQAPINKVVDLALIYKVSVDQKLSSVQNYRTNSSWKSTKPRTLTEYFWNSQKLNIQIKIVQNPLRIWPNFKH